MNVSPINKNKMDLQTDLNEVTDNQIDKKIWIAPSMEILEIEKNITIDILKDTLAS